MTRIGDRTPVGSGDIVDLLLQVTLGVDPALDDLNAIEVAGTGSFIAPTVKVGAEAAPRAGRSPHFAVANRARWFSQAVRPKRRQYLGMCFRTARCSSRKQHMMPFGRIMI